MIQFIDIDRQYQIIKKEILQKIEEVLDSKEFISGKYVTQFETQFATLHQSKYAIGCSNGTSAIALALEANGIKAEDEVITTPHTFIATAEAICHVRAKPVFVDIDPNTYNIDINKIENAITKKTKAIIPVHLYGNPVDMPALMRIGNKYNLFVIEDCAQAHLATFNDQSIGTFGNAGAFSFYPGKNLGAYGDAGAVITNSAKITEKIRKLSDHGRSKKYLHEIIGYNYRMDGLQAAILLIKMKYLKEWTIKRQEIAKTYCELLKNNVIIKLPQKHLKANPVYHLFVIQVNERDKIIQDLKKKGINTSIHYPIPLHLQPAFQHLGYKKGDFPNCEYSADHVISLPMFPELKKEEIEFICKTINIIVK